MESIRLHLTVSDTIDRHVDLYFTKRQESLFFHLTLVVDTGHQSHLLVKVDTKLYVPKEQPVLEISLGDMVSLTLTPLELKLSPANVMVQ